MKSIILASLLIAAPASYARCIVEIVDAGGDPLGHVFQGDTCEAPKARCEQKLRQLRNTEAKCEVTLDIGSKNQAEE